MEIILRLHGKKIFLVTVYRPESSNKNRYSLSEFYDDFTNLMAHYHTYTNEVIIVGDFNFHMIINLII